MARVVTFGEVMGRIAAPGFLRLRQALPGPLDVTFGGAEANVAASLAMLGAQAAFVTALPDNAIGDACSASLKALGIDTQHIIRTDRGRLGLYFLEAGANQRPSQVVYDRAGSAVSITAADRYDWAAIFDGAVWFHVTGITPAISQTAAEAMLAAVQAAKTAGLTVSCDLNFRKKLWRWQAATSPKELAEKTMREVLPHADLVVANEEDCAAVLGIHAAQTDVEAGELRIASYPAVARQLVAQFPNVTQVGITLRESISASHNNWGAMLYCVAEDRAYFAPLQGDAYRPYEIRNMIDRVGGGDAFAAGLIFALTTAELNSPDTAVRFATAASCLAHSIVGDFNYSSRAEVESLMAGSGSGRVVR
ncbi:MAG: carbohydrate kinase [Gemmatimonas sp. SG8_17]|nr:MAG: carbohydrate kinase [Gemmatimonas sp. SG8_17]